MKQFENRIGVEVPEIFLPSEAADFSKWAVVACDQYTSQPEYWEEARRIIGNAPSTLDLILPEAWLGTDEEGEKINAIRKNMRQYVENNTLVSYGKGFVLVTRTVSGKTRNGLVLALDLEQYDYHKGSETLIRATEGTIESRIPPRLKIRKGAMMELPHILVLIDDPEKTVIEPLVEKANTFHTIYDTELMQGGGHITGRMIQNEQQINSVLDSLEALSDPEAFHKKYGAHAPLLFAMGDGNHSFATAKAHWESIKKELSEGERENHPAKYALVEIENVHDDGIVFEPIHRVVFGIGGDRAARRIAEILSEQNGSASVSNEPLAASGGKKHVIPFFTENASGAFVVEQPSQQLAVGTLQNAIDTLLKEEKGEVDYIHGDDVVRSLSQKKDAIGFLLPAMQKSELFPTVVYDGALPRKTFSMGEANEKRFYMECRMIDVIK